MDRRDFLKHLSWVISAGSVLGGLPVDAWARMLNTTYDNTKHN